MIYDINPHRQKIIHQKNVRSLIDIVVTEAIGYVIPSTHANVVHCHPEPRK